MSDTTDFSVVAPPRRHELYDSLTAAMDEFLAVYELGFNNRLLVSAMRMKEDLLAAVQIEGYFSSVRMINSSTGMPYELRSVSPLNVSLRSSAGLELLLTSKSRDFAAGVYMSEMPALGMSINQTVPIGFGSLSDSGLVVMRMPREPVDEISIE